VPPWESWDFVKGPTIEGVQFMIMKVRKWHESLSTPLNEAKFHDDHFEERL